MGICSFLKTVMLKPLAKALLPSKTSKRHSVFVTYISIYSIYIHIIIMYSNLRWNCSSKTTGRHPFRSETGSVLVSPPHAARVRVEFYGRSQGQVEEWGSESRWPSHSQKVD